MWKYIIIVSTPKIFVDLESNHNIGDMKRTTEVL